MLGSKVVYKDNFAVITGTLTVNAKSGANKSINYPSGFNEENCVSIVCGIKTGTMGFNYVGKYDDAMDLYWNGYKRTLTLGGQNITLRIDNPDTNNTVTFSYKIVLMKI